MRPDDATLARIMSVEGMISADEAVLLYERAQTARIGILEIGAFRGRSTVALALGSQAGRRVPVWSLDPHAPESDDGYPYSAADGAAWLRNIVHAGVEDVVRPVFLPARMGMSGGASHVDRVFIDGNHEAPAPTEDMIGAMELLTSGGCILLHDRHAVGVQAALAHARQLGWTVTERAGSLVELQQGGT